LKITVITAVYNSEATVAEAIASVAAQTYPNVEHLIIEGKSKDGSLAAIEAASHDRMILVSEPDKGIYDALNKGILRATGDVIAFLHSDDFLAHADVLARIAAEFADPAVEAVFSDLDYVSQADTSRIVRRLATGPFAPERLKRGWMPAHPTLHLRRSVYDTAHLRQRPSSRWTKGRSWTNFQLGPHKWGCSASEPSTTSYQILT
jgi:glycosyltransferase involved in cell wall biosynthesis